VRGAGPNDRTPVAAQPGDRCIVRRSMALTREEFLRTFPSVLEGGSYLIDHDALVIDSPPGTSLMITLHSVPERRLGALRLPRLEVEIVFCGYNQDEREGFLQRFSRRFQRGGG